MDYEVITEKARKTRELCLRITECSKVGHLGGAFSAVELINTLYFSVLKIDPDHPDWEERDRFILSKGHACLGLYVTLALRGYFPEEWLFTFAQAGSRLQKHPDMHKTPGVDFTTGSLGQGASAAVGMALAGKMDRKSYRVFAMLGDGELDEGEVWEAALFAAHHQLDNLTFIIDHNNLQLDGRVANILNLEPLAAKWAAFGWEVREIDGHDIPAIDQALAASAQDRRPVAVIAHTVKGKGVSFMENQVKYHSGLPSPEEYLLAYQELGVAR